MQLSIPGLESGRGCLHASLDALPSFSSVIGSTALELVLVLPHK